MQVWFAAKRRSETSRTDAGFLGDWFDTRVFKFIRREGGTIEGYGHHNFDCES
jgi:hypothetical protein